MGVVQPLLLILAGDIANIFLTNGDLKLQALEIFKKIVYIGAASLVFGTGMYSLCQIAGQRIVKNCRKLFIWKLLKQ